MVNLLKIERIDVPDAHVVKFSIGSLSVLLDAAEVDAVIQHLSLLRASMQPAVAVMPSRSQQYVVELDPCWHIEKHPLYTGAVFFFRHTGLGWSGFALPDHSLAKMHASISQYFETELSARALPH
ncbi:hypothetical protein ACJ51O_35605 (plasmid) [Burkholderia pyrrocinia]|uniref:hypothetical protein n=1 Tax=Burkholderia pyrrocinia TaxID=60550 RepID=UPI0038B41CE2